MNEGLMTVPSTLKTRSESTPPAQPAASVDVTDLILEHRALAQKLASRYAGRGEPLEELIQVAMVGLVQAATRFDPDRGTSFSSYAVPTILGELRRYFRDHCWAMHIPRPLHDLYQEVLHATERLTGTLGRPPTVKELAKDLEVGEDAIIEAQEAGNAYTVRSLDAPTSADSDSDARTPAELLGSDDINLEHVEQREAVRRTLSQVPARERRILLLSFFGERTQAEIATELGMSQMHVSRLLAMTLEKVRTAVMNDDAAPIEWPTPRRRRTPAGAQAA
jgi:RNA polymerase sigma-B factor